MVSNTIINALGGPDEVFAQFKNENGFDNPNLKDYENLGWTIEKMAKSILDHHRAIKNARKNGLGVIPRGKH